MGVCSFLALNLAFWFFIAKKTDNSNHKGYPLLAKRLTVDNPNDNFLDFQPLRTEIQDYLDKTGLEHSYYFEYLPTGVSIRSGESNELIAASLMKLPLIMDVYKLAEQGKISLDDTITIKASDVDDKTGFGNVSNLKVGDKITYREAAKNSLTVSDNTSTHALFDATRDKYKPNEQAISFLDLDLKTEKENNSDYVYISSRSYSSIMKCLYLSCFNNQSSSNEILRYLTESQNRDRLPSGTSRDVKIANKIGTFQNKVQSDCAIVYEPNRPYLMCLMLFTDGKYQDTNPIFKKTAEMTQKYIRSFKN